MAAVQASCVDATIIPIVKGKTNISLGCFGCRKTTDIMAEEMLVGIPFKNFENVVKAVKSLGAAAIPKSRAKA
ncbi:putative ArCR [anaerobic digester metagenome]